MLKTTGRLAIACCGLWIVLAVPGCGRQNPAAEPQAAAVNPGDEADVSPAERSVSAPLEQPQREMAEDLASGQLPLRFPGSTADGARTADDVADDGAASQPGGLLDVLRQTVDLSPVFDQTGVQEGLSEGLANAADQLNRQKRDNRNAIREANRQVRIGAARSSPNLVLISVEGLGYGDLGCYGGSGTPQVDRLARRGLRFTNFYAGSANSRASRWCLMTGSNTGRAPVVEPGQERFTLSDVSSGNKVLPDVLWNAGYSTALVGVWDDRVNPLDCGYEQWSGVPARSDGFNSYPEVIYLDSTRARLPANSDGKQGVHAGDLLLQESLSYLDRNGRAERPCFLHLALPEFEVASAETDVPANVAELDRIVGGLLDWIDERELTSRTCVILMGVSTPPGSDQAAGRTGVLSVDEFGLSEGNLRVPMIVRWEGRIAAGEVSDHVCAGWDLLPTLADLAYVMRRPQRVDGLSFTGALLGRAQPEHGLLYWETRAHGFGQAVRMGDWKGVRLPRRTTLALFDLAADPGEQHDLSGERPEVVEQFVVRD